MVIDDGLVKAGPRAGQPLLRARGAGRPLKPLDLADIVRRAKAGCSSEQIAAVYECNRETLQVRLEEEFGINFHQLHKENKLEGQSDQITRLSESSWGPHLIFWLKNNAGYSDTPAIDRADDRLLSLMER